MVSNVDAGSEEAEVRTKIFPLAFGPKLPAPSLASLQFYP